MCVCREEEERDYVRWLKGEREEMVGGERGLSGLRKVWAAPDIDSGEAFLRDYILSRRFIDRDSTRLAKLNLCITSAAFTYAAFPWEMTSPIPLNSCTQ